MWVSTLLKALTFAAQTWSFGSQNRQNFCGTRRISWRAFWKCGKLMQMLSNCWAHVASMSCSSHSHVAVASPGRRSWGSTTDTCSCAKGPVWNGAKCVNPGAWRSKGKREEIDTNRKGNGMKRDNLKLRKHRNAQRCQEMNRRMHEGRTMKA